jgi:hypothetical protein
MSSARRGATAVAGVLAGVVVVLLFVILAARAGQSGIIRGTGHDGVFHAVSPSASVSSTVRPIGHDRPGPPPHTPWWAHAILIGLAALACSLVLLAAFSALGLLRQISLPGRRRAPEDEAVVGIDWLEDPEAAAEQIRKGSDLREQLLRTGSPRNAIVACWSRFEEQATEVGLAPRVWETPSEFTVRVLRDLARDHDAVDRLERLYVEARFSRHEITEEHRDRAIEAVRRVHRSLLTATVAES